MNLRWISAAIVAVLFALAQVLPGRGLPLGQAVTNMLTGSGPAGESVGIALAARRSKDEKDKKDDNRNDNKHDNGDDDDDDENGNSNSNQDDRDEGAENVDAYENADNAPGEGQNDGEPEQAATLTPTSGSSSAASTAPSTAPSSAGGEPAPTPTLISPAAAAAPAAAPTRQRPAATPTPTTDAAAQPTPTSAEGSGTAPAAAGSQGSGAPTPSPSLTPTTEPTPTVGPPPTEPQVSGVANGNDMSIALGGDRVVIQVFPSMPTGTTIFVKRATKDQFPPVPGALVSDLIFVLEARDPSGGILLELPAQVNLIVHYQDADAGALVESRFTLSHLSLIDYSWRPTANQVKDAGANYVSAPISELGAYAVHVP